MILADLQDWYLTWKRETSMYSVTSGPRSPTKMLNSGPLSSRRSWRPPPLAQFSLKGRWVFGMRVPLYVRALAAACGDMKSTKQYPALLLAISDEVVQSTYPVNLSRIILTLTCSPMVYQIFLTACSSTHGSNSPILHCD